MLLTLRVRLTFAVVFLVATAASVALIVGMQRLQAGTINSAAERVVQIGTDSFDTFATVTINTDVESLDGIEQSQTPSEWDGESRGTIEALEVEFYATTIDQLGLRATLVENFGAPLRLKLLNGDVVAIESADAPSESSIPVLASSIDQIASSTSSTQDRGPTGRRIELTTVSHQGSPVGVVVDVTDSFDVLGDVAAALWWSILGLTISAGTGAWVLVGRSLAPVSAITARAASIATGDLVTRIAEPKRHDEVGQLARTVNAMLSRLESSELQRRRFVADASHELRTPVAVLQSEAELAIERPESTSVADLAHAVLGEGHRLGAMVEDLLVLARGHNTTPFTSAEPVEHVDLDELVLAEVTRTRRVPIDVTGVTAGRVRGYSSDLARAVTHLVDNATRYANSRVAIEIGTCGCEVILRLDDDGPGVKSDDRRRVFERFVRLDDARRRDRGGAGLGLAVVNEIVESSGGTIAIHDSPLGGARFEVRLPQAPTHIRGT